MIRRNERFNCSQADDRLDVVRASSHCPNRCFPLVLDHFRVAEWRAPVAYPSVPLKRCPWSSKV